MRLGLLIRIFLCIIIFVWCLYSYVNRHNTLTKLQLEIPKQQKELGAIEEQNKRLQYEIDKFENPVHLMELAQRPEFGHLKHPLVKDIIVIPMQEENHDQE